jgi:hypothetical protein
LSESQRLQQRARVMRVEGTSGAIPVILMRELRNLNENVKSIRNFGVITQKPLLNHDYASQNYPGKNKKIDVIVYGYS